jgi:EmrB/QacA subfamily drug resistance transporter
MGACAALIFPTTLSIISNTFSERRERAAALGVWGAVVGIGVAAGPVTGGWLLTDFYWGSVFLALIPVALVAAGLTLALVPESKDPAVPPLDRPGLALSVAMLGVLTYTIIEAPDHGWTSVLTLSGFVLSAALLVRFVLTERRAAHPMLDVSLFRDRRFSAASGAVTVTFFALFGFIFLITQYFQFVRGYGTLSTGARILPVALSIAVASVIGAALAPRIGTRAVVTTGLILFGSAFLWVSTVDAYSSYPAVVVPQMVLMGLGMGLISTPATESILQVLPPARAGVGSAVNDATRELGGTLGVAVVGSLFSSVYAARLADGLFGRLPAGQLAAAQDSVGAAKAIAARGGGLQAAMHDAFMSGLHTSCLLIGVLCLLGAVGAVVALPGRVPARTEEPRPASSPAPVG